MIIYNPGIKPKNKHIQSFLASSKIRLIRLRKGNVLYGSKVVYLETSKATLQGFYTKNKESKSLYILLHGWEGSADSTYIQLLANTLYKNKKASVFRLNFRDHGETHHLNKELFHSCRLKEVVEAINQVTEKFNYDKVYLCGFSLGGNFSLRVAAKTNTLLTKVFAVSPPLVPKNSMITIEASSIYSRYFLKKWKKSLTKKHHHFPRLFDNNQINEIKSLDELTKVLIIEHSDYNTTDDYFNGYRISNEILKQIKIPCHVITAWDDPVIPFEDFGILEKKRNIILATSRHGGHCGFINSWLMHSWVEQYLLENT